MNILEIKNLNLMNKHLPNKMLLEDISFNLEKGETLGIVGESGSGKTLTGLSIMSLLDKNTFSIEKGEINYQDMSLLDLDDRSLQSIRGNKISMIFQEPMLSLNPVLTINTQLTEIIKLHITDDNKKVQDLSKNIIIKTGLEDYQKILQSYPHMLSGGQRQRVMIAIALVCNPDILIADEPTTALDVTLQLQILELLQDFKKERKMSLILISHDLDLIKKYSDRLIILQDGHIVEQGHTNKIFANPQHEYTKRLISSNPQRLVGNPPKDNILLDIKNLSCKFLVKNSFFKNNRKYFSALKDINLNIKVGETIGIVGESGSGKTTLAMTILQLLSYDGTIVFDGENISTMPSKYLRKFRKKFQIVFQDPFSSLSPRYTIQEILSEGILAFDKTISDEKVKDTCKNLLSEVGLSENMLQRYPHQFSGGQRQRIAIARALSMKPKLIILDEPTSALDVLVQKNILELLVSLQKKYSLSYCFISHDLKVIRSISHRIYIIKESRVIESNATNQILDNPQTEYTKNLIKSSFLT